MKKSDPQPAIARRQFLTQVGMGAGVLGAVGATSPTAWAQTASEGQRWQPARLPLDEWYDKIPGQHRFVFDTITPEGLGMALQFANNFLEASKSGYGLQDSDSAVIVVVRHKSTGLGYNDAMWAKYGTQLSKQANDFVDPQSKEVPKVNVYATPGANGGRPGRMAGLIQRGVHIAVCQMATRAIAGTIARATSAETDAVFAELSANLVGNGQLVPAGILAVNRAQEHGYALAIGG